MIFMPKIYLKQEDLHRNSIHNPDKPNKIILPAYNVDIPVYKTEQDARNTPSTNATYAEMMEMFEGLKTRPLPPMEIPFFPANEVQSYTHPQWFEPITLVVAQKDGKEPVIEAYDLDVTASERAQMLEEQGYFVQTAGAHFHKEAMEIDGKDSMTPNNQDCDMEL